MLQLKVCLVKSIQEKRKYTHFTPQQRAKIVKYTSECGIQLLSGILVKIFHSLEKVL